LIGGTITRISDPSSFAWWRGDDELFEFLVTALEGDEILKALDGYGLSSLLHCGHTVIHPVLVEPVLAQLRKDAVSLENVVYGGNRADVRCIARTLPVTRELPLLTDEKLKVLDYGGYRPQAVHGRDFSLSDPMRTVRVLVEFLHIDDLRFINGFGIGTGVDDPQAEVARIFVVWKLDVLCGRAVLEVCPVAPEGEAVYVTGCIGITVGCFQVHGKFDTLISNTDEAEVGIPVLMFSKDDGVSLFLSELQDLREEVDLKDL
jgi:hypothetical protein